ncbi:DUF3887 domain-containing protein, partial [Arachidicoccus sp.]|uniref:DUF3887 domain-containing protein n=1 Tax=Arachidicoccus sp. TaxID=1872624 RepID=UPI003D1C12DD
MKKYSLLIIALFGIAVCIKAQANADIAKSFVQNISTAKYQDALTLTDSAFQKAVSENRLEEIWAAIEQRIGSFTKIDSVITDAKSVTVDADFEKAQQPLNFYFNQDHQVVGFFLGHAVNKSALSDTSVYPEKDFSLVTPAGTLKGLLTSPLNATAQTPVAIIIAGSGPTDKDGNDAQMGLYTNDYKLLADALAKNGVACLRYDKRMVGESNNFSTDESKLRFDDYVNDVDSLIVSLRRNYTKIFLIGHSEGSLVGILAAEKMNPAGFISLAGAGENIADILKKQLSTLPQAQSIDSILNELRNGNLVANTPKNLQSLFRASVQPYLISWMKYNPEVEIAKLSCPALILQGNTDLQVSLQDATNLKKGNPQAQLKIIAGMNHILKDAPMERQANIATYANPSLPLNQELVDTIVGFIHAVPALVQRDTQ